MATLQELQESLATLHEQATAITNKAEEEDRQTTDEEQDQFEALMAQANKVGVQIQNMQKLESAASLLPKPKPRARPAEGPPTEPPPPAQGMRNTSLQSAQEKNRWGFKHVGEFYNAVRLAKGGQVDPRLIANATTFSTEGVGEDGGFAVPPDWRSSIMDLAFNEESLYGRTDQQTTSSNQMSMPVTENPQWGNPGGITTQWLEEGGTLTEQKAALKLITVRANKLGAYVKASDELLGDAAAMGRYITTKAPMAIEFAVSDAIMNGNGVGKPLGVLNSPGRVTVATRLVVNQVAPADIINIWKRMPAQVRGGAVWVMNQDVEALLPLMSLKVTNVAGTENVGGWPIFIPPGGLPNTPSGSLLGRPIVVNESCPALGTEGDISLVNFSWYLTLVKAGGIRADTSIHVDFAQDLMAFRFIMRVGGQPWLSAPVARKNGTNTFSAYVTLSATGA